MGDNGAMEPMGPMVCDGARGDGGDGSAGRWGDGRYGANMGSMGRWGEWVSRRHWGGERLSPFCGTVPVSPHVNDVDRKL